MAGGRPRSGAGVAEGPVTEQGARPPPSGPGPSRPLVGYEWRIPLAYAVASGLWILGSDRLAAMAARDAAHLALLSTYKGLGFVAVTTVFLYLGVRAALARERASHRLAAEADALLRAVMEANPDPVFLKDRAGRYLYANPADLRALGKRADEVMGRTDREVQADPELAAASMAVDRRVMESGRAEDLDERLPSPEGMRVYRTSKAPWLDAQGRVTGLIGSAHDITERVAAEAALRARHEAEDRLAMVAASVPGAVCAFEQLPDGTARMALSTAAVEELYGFPSAEMAVDMSPVLRRIDEADVPGVVASIAESAQTLTPWHACYRYDHPLKGRRWIEVWSTPRRLPGGGTIWHGFNTDVTDRRGTEEALASSEARYRSVVENLSEGLVIFDTDGRFLHWNPAARGLLGLGDAADSVGGLLADPTRWFTLSSLEGLPLPRERWPMRRILAGEQLRGLVVRLHRAGSPSHRLLRCSGELVLTTGAPPVGIFSFTDVTDQERTAAALRDSEARFRALTEGGTDVVLVLDPFGRVNYASRSATDLLGWSTEELAGRQLAARIHADDRRAAWRALAQLRDEPGTPVRFTVRVAHRDGSWRILEAAGRNRLDEAAVAGLVINARDATAQRGLEEQVRQSQKLESVGRLAGGVAHDFNNLLTVILQTSEVMRSEAELGAAPAREDLDAIHQASLRARDLTRQLLAFARKQVIAPSSVDLVELLRSSEKLLRRVLGEDVQILADLPASTWPVRADPGQIEQVVMNLAVNARDAMPGGGRLDLSVGNLELGAAEAAALEGLRPGPHVRLSVGDTGTGMTPEVMAHMFEPFFTTKPRGLGTGLGLATVYGIVRQMEGAIRAESAPGQGTRFDILLPRTGEAVAASAAPHPAPAGGSETVLLVEDEAAVRRVVSRALERAGYHVESVATGHAALAAAERLGARLDLLITDMILTDLDGKQVAEAVRRTVPGAPVLVISGYAGEAISRVGQLGEGVEFLQKPFTSDALLRRVRAILDGKVKPA
jgi:PAS domain S-box-containing protein